MSSRRFLEFGRSWTCGQTQSQSDRVSTIAILHLALPVPGSGTLLFREKRGAPFNRARHSEQHNTSCQTWDLKQHEDRTSHRTQQGSREDKRPSADEARGARGQHAPGQHAHRSVRTRAARRCAHSAITIGASTAIDSSAIGMPIALCIESKEPLCSVAPAVAGVSVVASAIAPAAAELSAQSIW